MLVPTLFYRNRGRTDRLTGKGRELGEVVIALTTWGDQWAAPHGPPIRYEHAGCGGTVTTTTTCTGCEAHPGIADVLARPGAGATTEQRAAMEARQPE